MINHEDIIKIVSKGLKKDHSLVETIIKSTYKDVVRVLSNTDTTEVELSGIGKLRLNKSKTLKKLDKLYIFRDSYNEKLKNHNSGIVPLSFDELRNLNKRILSVNKDINNIEKKYNRSNK